MADLHLADPSIDSPGLAHGGGGGNNGGMEARIAKLEAASEHVVRELSELRQDIREVRQSLRSQTYWMVGGFAWFTLSLAAMLGVIAKGFGWL